MIKQRAQGKSGRGQGERRREPALQRHDGGHRRNPFRPGRPSRRDRRGARRSARLPDGPDPPRGRRPAAGRRRLGPAPGARSATTRCRSATPRRWAIPRVPRSRTSRRTCATRPATTFLARARLGATTDAAFRERWALFWANHFTVSSTSLAVAAVAGPFEQEAIRPHVFGRFEDLLVASSTHPAMLLYLDQAQSVGPDSKAARPPAQERQEGRRAEREPGPRDPGTAHGRGRRRLQPGRRHRVRPGHDRFQRRPGEGSQPAPVPVPRQRPRARRADGDGPSLSAGGPGPGPGGDARPGRQSPHRPPRLDQAGRPLRQRHAAAGPRGPGCGRPISTAAAAWTRWPAP
jgi:hypothetical protein